MKTCAIVSRFLFLVILLTTNMLVIPSTAAESQTSVLAKSAAIAGIDFDTLLFIGYFDPPGDVHMCDQYYGWNAKNGGGLYMLTGLRTGQTTLINILKNSTVQNGRFKGKNLDGGAFQSIDLSYDGNIILFAWSNETDKCYHIFKVNKDGSELTQLTDGKTVYNGFLTMDMSQNDFSPCWLPNGRIVFVSERRGGYLRCSGLRPCPTYTLYSMKADGTDIFPLSYHETNEWDPSVTNDGRIVYTRWDYIDRDDCIAHHLWFCNADGTDPRCPHGNYPLPANTLSGTNFRNGKSDRPNGEWHIRAIPNSNKFVAVASGHHSHSYGHLVLIDPTVEDDNAMSQVKGITTNQTSWADAAIGPYCTPWPLAEGLYLANKDNTIILRDNTGKESVLYSSNTWRPMYPIPLQPRAKPTVAVTKTWQGERSSLPDHYRATLSVLDVSNADLSLPAGVKIKWMRIVQVMPELQPIMNNPRIGYGAESLVRMSIGTVPVESDGSVYCEAPVGKEVYFQLLDSNYCAVQSMRSGTYVHAGEQLSCVGCHENKWKAVPPYPSRLAFKRPPSPITPEANGVEPINFYRLVKPVFDAKCASCHKVQGKGPDMSYQSLLPYAFYITSNTPSTDYLNDDIVFPGHGGSRSIPGMLGARYSKLFTHLNPSHHNVNLTADETRRITLWLDCNSVELGAYHNVDAQRQGKLVWPTIDVDSLNPQGIEKNFPLPGTTLLKNGSVAKSVTPEIKISRFGSVITFENHLHQTGIISLFDCEGRRVFKCGIYANSEMISIDLKKAVPGRGTYLVDISFANGIRQRNLSIMY